MRIQKCEGYNDTEEESLGSLTYNWEASTNPPVSFSLNVDNIKERNGWGAKLFIPKGTLASGITYNFTVTGGRIHETI